MRAHHETTTATAPTRLPTTKIRTVLRHFKLHYKDELTLNIGALEERYPTEKKREHRILSKIYGHCLLSLLLEKGNSSMVVIGRVKPFYIPDGATCEKDLQISRMNTGIIFIPEVGAFVIDLGATYWTKVIDNKKGEISLAFDEEQGLQAHYLNNINKIVLPTNYVIEKEAFPFLTDLIPVTTVSPVLATRLKKLSEFHESVAEKAKNMLSEMSNLPLEKRKQLIGKVAVFSESSCQTCSESMYPDPPCFMPINTGQKPVLPAPKVSTSSTGLQASVHVSPSSTLFSAPSSSFSLPEKKTSDIEMTASALIQESIARIQDLPATTTDSTLKAFLTAQKNSPLKKIDLVIETIARVKKDDPKRIKTALGEEYQTIQMIQIAACGLEESCQLLQKKPSL